MPRYFIMFAGPFRVSEENQEQHPGARFKVQAFVFDGSSQQATIQPFGFGADEESARIEAESKAKKLAWKEFGVKITIGVWSNTPNNFFELPDSDEVAALKRQAVSVWLDYQRVILRRFNCPDDWVIDTTPLENALVGATAVSLNGLISYLQGEISDIDKIR